MFKGRWALIAGLLAISALSSACESGDSQSNALSADEVAARYGYDLTSATLTPVYALVPEFGDPRDAYARDLLARRCLAGVIDYPVHVPEPATDQDVFDPRTAERIFTEAVAARWGYQIPAPSAADRQEAGTAITPEIQSQMEACGQQTRERLGLPPNEVLNAFKTAGWDAVEGNSEVEAAAAEWRECMAPIGVADLPDSPLGMPSPSVVTPGSRTVDPQGNTVESGNNTLSARERDVAVADARCRDQANVGAIQFRVRAEAELAAIGRDIEGFESARQEFQEYDNRINQVIEELG